MLEFTRQLATADNQPEAAFRAMARLTEELVGVRLFTLMTFDPATRGARRLYSNMPDIYPVLGTKPINDTYWTGRVLEQHRTFVANSIDGIAEVFDDHALIRSLGCESVINVPIVVAGETLGTINCLHEAGFYTPQRVEASEALKLPGAACFLLNMSQTLGED
jgi:GAF domain-containing protein